MNHNNGSNNIIKCCKYFLNVTFIINFVRHYCEDVANANDESSVVYPQQSIFSSETIKKRSKNFLDFFMVPIVKSANHRKHNSHHWFFQGICQALGDKASVAFLTDCGTSYTVECLAKLSYELLISPDLIGVTARQRVENPNHYFHPCEETAIPFFRGDHAESGDPRPCWKCYASFYCSPAPLQGFEFEGSLLLSSALFNIVEAMPVMPGPCQLLDWKK